MGDEFGFFIRVEFSEGAISKDTLEYFLLECLAPVLMPYAIDYHLVRGGEKKVGCFPTDKRFDSLWRPFFDEELVAGESSLPDIPYTFLQADDILDHLVEFVRDHDEWAGPIHIGGSTKVQIAKNGQVTDRWLLRERWPVIDSNREGSHLRESLMPVLTVSITSPRIRPEIQKLKLGAFHISSHGFTYNKKMPAYAVHPSFPGWRREPTAEENFRRAFSILQRIIDRCGLESVSESGANINYQTLDNEGEWLLPILKTLPNFSWARVS